MTDQYPYVEIAQVTRNMWSAELITREIDKAMYTPSRIKYAGSEASANKKGIKLLAKYGKRYGDLAKPYRIY